MRDKTFFEYCLELDGRELWIEVTESGISHWYDRTGALEAIPETRNLERRAFMEELLGGGKGRTALRVTRGRENFTVSVELPEAVLSQIRQVAGISAKSGMTADDEKELDRLLDPIFRNYIQEFLPPLGAK